MSNPSTTSNLLTRRFGGGLRAGGIALMLAVVLLTIGLSRSSAQGAPGVLDKFRSGNLITVGANETVPHDLYVGAGTVRIDGRIDGDLFIGGGTVDVTGPVTGDLFIGGGTVHVSGPVGRHLRIGGGDVTVNGPVKLDLLVGAGNLNIGSGAVIDGDAIFSAGQVQLDGAVAGSVLGSAQTYTKTGRIAGTEQVTIPTSEPAAVQAPASQTAGQWLLGKLQRYVGILLVGALLLVLLPRVVVPSAALVRTEPLRTMGMGVVGFVGFFPFLIALLIAMVFAAVILGFIGLGGLVAVVVIGMLLGLSSLVLAFVTVIAFVAFAVVGLTVGQLAIERLGVANWGVYGALAIGVLGVVVVTAIPVVGWIVGLAVALIGLGALIVRLWRGRPRRGMAQALPASETLPAPGAAPLGGTV